MKAFPINKEEEEFLCQHFKPVAHSKFFFQPFRTSSRAGRWLVEKYAYSGSQSTRTRGDFEKAFLHVKDSNRWGWTKDYIDVLRRKLTRDHTDWIPAFWLSVWLFRDKDWSEPTTPLMMIKHLYAEFGFCREEIGTLFDSRVPQDVPDDLFQERPCSEADFLRITGPPPDASPEGGGSLSLLELHGVGPSHDLTFQPGDRLTIVTGDNGLGKSFLLECAWWSLTGEWAGNPALPRQDADKGEPQITFKIASPGSNVQKTTIRYDWERHRWPRAKGRVTVPGLIVYARVDGSFAVWDPVRPSDEPDATGALVFSRDDVLNGRSGSIEGLLRDWVKWQHSPDKSLFETFVTVLKQVSPPDLGPLCPGEAVRIPGDVREIPTLIHSYGTVPFVNESAGVRRIITLAYLLVWARNEHNVHSGMARKTAQKRMVVLIDEVEAHLHPKWQREILPAVLEVGDALGGGIEAQILVTTHSPLVLASVEGKFRSDTDKLYHLQLSEQHGVDFAEIPFVRLGRVDGWLTSDVFDLKEARSIDGETAVERAKTLMSSESPTKDDIIAATAALEKSLPPDDVFWRRWVYFAERNGVEI